MINLLIKLEPKFKEDKICVDMIATVVFQWSFGIVLWELLTRGVTPYPDVEPKNIKSYLNGGKRLKKPRQCPESL